MHTLPYVRRGRRWFVITGVSTDLPSVCLRFWLLNPVIFMLQSLRISLGGRRGGERRRGEEENGVLTHTHTQTRPEPVGMKELKLNCVRWQYRWQH